MNKILLLGINSRYTHSNPALYYLKQALAGLDVSVSILEFSAGEKSEKIAADITAANPDILAVSVYIWNSLHVKKIIPPVKESLPGIRIVLGGPEVSYNSSEWMSGFSEIDFIITGGGEAAFRNLAVSGFNTERGVIQGCNGSFNTVRFPYSDGDMESLKGRFIYYESSRGCPFNCSYCLSSVKGGAVEFRDHSQVRDELDFFARYGLPLLKFVDRTFNLKKEHYRPVWEHIVKQFSGLGTCFHFEIFPELLDEDDLRFLSSVPAGLFQFEMGIQSTNPAALKEIRRTGSWAGAEKNIRKLAEPGNIHLHTDLIAGLPHEDLSSYIESFNRVYSLGAGHFQGGFLKILPGTEMHQRAHEYGLAYNPLPPYEITENRWINAREMERLKLISELTDLIHNAGRFPQSEKFLVSLYGAPFAFYNRMSDFFTREGDASHRRPENLCRIMISMVKTDHPESSALLTDYLRWDWCTIMKRHHYPEILTSESTANTRKTGFMFFLHLADKKKISYSGITFTTDDLRHSIFFAPESGNFKKEMMDGNMALFLPDKRIIFFNPVS